MLHHLNVLGTCSLKKYHAIGVKNSPFFGSTFVLDFKMILINQSVYQLQMYAIVVVNML